MMAQQSVLSVVCVLVLAWLAETKDTIYEPAEGRMDQVSVGPAGVWAINQFREVFYLEESYIYPALKGSQWTKVEGSLVQLDVGTDVVYGVDNRYRVYYRARISSGRPDGYMWVEIEGTNLSHVTVSPNGYVWGVNIDNQVFMRKGTSSSNPKGTSWEVLDGMLKQISAGPAGVWGISPDNKVLYRVGTYGDTGSMGVTWTEVGGMVLRYVSSGDGYVVALDMSGRLYKRNGMSVSHNVGTSWSRVEEATTVAKIDLYGEALWAVDDNEFVKYAMTTGTDLAP